MYIHRLILMFVLGAFLFSPIIIDWWVDSTGSWYRPFALWLVLIGISIWILRWEEEDES